MNTTSIRSFRFFAGLLAAATVLLGADAQAGTSCGPSGRAGVERCVSGLAPAALMQMQQRQEASNWCWAASISMLLRRYGVEVPQQDVVREHLGKLENVPIAVDEMSRLVDRRWQDAQGRSIVASVTPMPSWRMRLGVAAPEVLAELDHERPVILAAEKHAMLLVQVVYDRVTDAAAGAGAIELVRAVVLDPQSPSGVRSLRAGERRPDLLALVRTDAPAAAVGAAAASTLVAATGQAVTGQ
jgi:hypothetical protein